MSYENRTNEHEELMRKKTSYLFKNKSKVHLTLKGVGWERGWIEEQPSVDFLILKLTKEGQLKSHVKSKVFFFLEMEDIQEFMEVRYGK